MAVSAVCADLSRFETIRFKASVLEEKVIFSDSGFTFSFSGPPQQR